MKLVIQETEINTEPAFFFQETVVPLVVHEGKLFFTEENH